MSSMNAKKEHMWQAYIDGELSATDMATFEETLSASDRRLLSSDVQFDRALSERLSEDACCPADVWARTKALLESQSADAENDTPDNVVPLNRSWIRNFVTIAAAAMITLMVSWVIAPGSDHKSVIFANESVGELAANSAVDASSEQIQQYMQQNNYELRLVALDKLRIVQLHGNVELIGAAHSNDGELIELYVACCRHPVKIIMAERNTPEAEFIVKSLGKDNDLQATRLVNGYVVGVVSKHHAVGMLDIFAEQKLQKGTL